MKGNINAGVRSELSKLEETVADPPVDKNHDGGSDGESIANSWRKI